MTAVNAGLGWLVMAIRVPDNPSRHQVAAWRELRRIGAVSLGGGTWAAPAAPVFADGLAKLADLVHRAEGISVALDAAPHSPAGRQALLTEFNAARDIFTAPEGVDAEDKLKRCAETLDAYADEIYAAAPPLWEGTSR